MIKHIKTIIIGGGQAGLASSYCLKQQGREHMVFKRAPWAANAWRKRWDSFTLVTPNWMIDLSGAPYQEDDPDGLLDREEIIAYIEAYSQWFNLPIGYWVEVTSVEPSKASFLVRTDQGDFKSDNVISAVGFYQQCITPGFSLNCPVWINQIHSSEYKNLRMLPKAPFWLLDPPNQVDESLKN